MAKGGSSQPVKQEVVQSNLPEYARPYFESMMQRGQSLLTQGYTPYGQERIAGFTPQQEQLQQDILGQQTPGEFGTAANLATAAGLGSLQAGQYGTGQFGAQQIGQPNLQQFSMGAPDMVQAGEYGSPQMQAAQTGYQPNLNYFQMEGPQQFGMAQAQQYMSPFIQQALEPQMREAVYSAKRGQLAEDLGAARQGTYGGSRQLLASMERERNLGQQMGDIQARGLQSAFENAQQQFERDRAAGMTAGQENLRAALGIQGLEADIGSRMALANLDAESQANVQNLAAQLQTQGMNADQALRAALANQQAGLTVGQQNLDAALQTQQLGTTTGLEALRANQQADLERQRMGEQSRQFGAQQGLAGLAQAGQMGQTLTNIGSARSQADQARYGLQTSTAAQQQALRQQYLDTAYQDFLRQRDYPLEMLQQYSSLLRGVPVKQDSAVTTYAPSPGIGQQLLGTGLSAASIYNTANRAGVI
jgi:hypothetical protein